MVLNMLHMSRYRGKTSRSTKKVIQSENEAKESHLIMITVNKRHVVTQARGTGMGLSVYLISKQTKNRVAS